MASKFKVGQRVRQILPAPQEGVVKMLKFDETTGNLSVLFDMVSTDADGVETTIETVFLEDQVELVPEV